MGVLSGPRRSGTKPAKTMNAPSGSGTIQTACRAAKVHRSCRPAVRVMKSAENRSSNNDAMRLWSAR